MEMQHAGYMTLEARPLMGEPAPAWVMGIWGSDVYLFGRISSHRDRVRAVLAGCDYYLCECRRDVDLAMNMGLKGRVLPPLPAHGGLDLHRIDDVGQRLPPSRRRAVMIKGYQSFAGRALTALRAVALAVDSMDGHQVRVYSASPDVRIAAEVLAADTGLDVEVLPKCSHRELLAHMAEARVVIALSISDGLPSSLVEAMGLGAFPIHSSTSCASEWIAPGTTGFLVSAEDPVETAEALKTALSDDMLVDSAADLNRRVVCEYLAADVITPQAIAMYRGIVGSE
jgi:glycosyltransferase involved in cell wall biosynthesis